MRLLSEKDRIDLGFWGEEYPPLSGDLFNLKDKQPVYYTARYILLAGNILGVELYNHQDNGGVPVGFVERISYEQFRNKYERCAQKLACSMFDELCDTKKKRMEWVYAETPFFRGAAAKELSAMQLIRKMAKIVEKYTEIYKTDFYLYDIPTIRACPEDRYIWLVRDTRTGMLSLDKLKLCSDKNKIVDAYMTYLDNYSGISSVLVYEIKRHEIKKSNFEKAIKLVSEVSND